MSADPRRVASPSGTGGPAADAFTELRLKTDRTLAFTWGKWGGFYRIGGGFGWRVCVGWLAVTFVRDEFASMLRAYLDRLEADDAR